MSPAEAEIIMRVMLPAIMTLFANPNITSLEYQATFKEPCKFTDLIDLFSSLPPYFNEIGKQYGNRTDLIAYYSMQLSSTFLVNRNALTMKCLYQMLDLQKRVGTLAIGIMDRPDENKELVGMFGGALQPMMKPLRQNAMLKLIEFVETYEKNGDMGTITKFEVMNPIFVIISVIGIIGNIILIVILHKSRKLANKSYLFRLIHKHYKTKLLLIVILVCNCMYLLNNFIIMSQFGLASHALGGLNKLNLACKLAFTLFPPTTAYTLLKQLSVILLVIVIREHHLKLRTIKLLDNFYVINNYTLTLNNNKNRQQQQRKANQHQMYKIKNPKNLYMFLIVLAIVFAYNAPNLFLYSLAKLTNPQTGTVVYYCAYTQAFAERTFVLTQAYLYPILNLVLFVFVPFTVGLLYILFDICHLIRMYKEEPKRYEYLNLFIEYPIYVYFFVYFLCDFFFAFHQLYDLLAGTVSFPFVFPIFIRMTFSSKVDLVIFENLLLCLSCSSMFFIWLTCDRMFFKLVKQIIYKHIFCRVTSNIVDAEHIIVDDEMNKLKQANQTASTSSTSSAGSSSGTCTSIRTISKNDAIKSVAGVLHASAAINSFDMIDDQLEQQQQLDLLAKQQKYNDYYNVEQNQRMGTYKSLLDQNPN